MNTTIRDDLAHFQSLWDVALEKMQLEEPKEETPIDDKSAVELLQERQRAAGSKLDIHDMLILSEDIDRVFHPERLTEQELSKKDIGDIVTRQQSSPNPVRGGTIGLDQGPDISPDFTDSPVLRDLHDVKVRLEEVERKLHAAEVVGNQNQENSLNKEVASLRFKLEELSNKLIPHRLMGSDAD